VQEAVQEINARLKAAKHRCSLSLRGGRLSLVATLPERDDPSRKRQQRISLGLDASLGGLEQGERKAMELGFELRSGTFTWTSWDAPPESEVLTVADFRLAAERLHQSKFHQSPERGAVAWNKKWSPALNKMPPSGRVDQAVLLRVIRSIPAKSAARLDQGNILAQIAKAVGLDPAPIREAASGYGAAALTPREIPTDAEIEAAWSAIKQPHWQWAFGLCAAFGLRPHECAEAHWLANNWLLIAEETKTGTRQTHACPSRWIEQFKLHELPRPSQSPKTMTTTFGKALRRSGVTIKPYNLRHAYALRLMDNGVPPELGARLMGHSLQVHEQTYKRWLEAERITKAMSRFEL
jgi:integrase